MIDPITEGVIMSEIQMCNYWLDKYEESGDTFGFDEWYLKREKLKQRLNEGK